MQEENYIKYELYKRNKEKLKMTMKNECYFEALIIEYAIIEDRINLLFTTINCKLSDKLCKNLSRMKTNSIFKNNKFIRDRITVDLIDKLNEWRTARNEVIHLLYKEENLDIDAKLLADEGFELQKLLDNKVKSIRDHYERLRKKQEEKAKKAAK